MKFIHISLKPTRESITTSLLVLTKMVILKHVTALARELTLRGLPPSRTLLSEQKPPGQPGRQGNIRTTTLRAFSEEDMERMLMALG